MPDANLSVLKFGSSVIPGPESMPQVVEEIHRELRRGRRVIAVVSAFGRTTDSLEEVARRLTQDTDDPAYAHLLGTGEAQTVDCLSLALKAASILARCLHVSDLGLRTSGPRKDAEPSHLDAENIHRALAEADVLVVPGFVGLDAAGLPTLLGRGGSDLTALFVAHHLGATCRLLKDVNGWFERDPRMPGPRPRRYEQLSFADALANPAPIVQTRAVVWAQRLGQSFEVACLGSDSPTVVGLPTRTQPPDE